MVELVVHVGVEPSGGFVVNDVVGDLRIKLVGKVHNNSVKNESIIIEMTRNNTVVDSPNVGSVGFNPGITPHWLREAIFLGLHSFAECIDASRIEAVVENGTRRNDPVEKILNEDSNTLGVEGMLGAARR